MIRGIALQRRPICITLIGSCIIVLTFSKDNCPDNTVGTREQGNRGPFVMETVKADDKAKLGELFTEEEMLAFMFIHVYNCRKSLAQ